MCRVISLLITKSRDFSPKILVFRTNLAWDVLLSRDILLSPTKGKGPLGVRPSPTITVLMGGGQRCWERGSQRGCWPRRLH